MNPSDKRVAGIVLAAGRGARMGAAKQLLPLDNTTILGRVIETVRASTLGDILLVLGYRATSIRAVLNLDGVRVVENPDWEKGQSFSLKAGLQALSDATDGALFLLGDQPLVSVNTINCLVSAFQTTDSWILAPHFKGRRGNPVLVGKPLFSRLAALTGDTGARVLFEEFKSRRQSIAVDDAGILTDIDTPADYQALLSVTNKLV